MSGFLWRDFSIIQPWCNKPESLRFTPDDTASRFLARDSMSVQKDRSHPNMGQHLAQTSGSCSIGGTAALALLLSCSGAAIAQNANSKQDGDFHGRATPGQSVFGRHNFIEYVVGNLPIIISVPHGGYLRPENLPDRDLGTPGRQDIKTQELAREIIECFRQQTGKFPHTIINRLHREKLDANRELFDAALDDPIAGEAWNEFHAFIDSAQHRVIQKFGKGLYIDLHGHRHDWQAVELGYLLVSSQLNLSDAELDATVSSATTSVGLNVGKDPIPLSQLVRGPGSLGAALEQFGFPTVPSPAHPSPNGRPYFSGGFNLEQHSSFSGRPMFGVQIETPMSLRENDGRRRAFAEALVKSILAFLKEMAL